MSDDRRVILRFYIAPDWDAHTQVAYVYAPTNWGEMDQVARDNFLTEEADIWVQGRVDYGAEVFNREEWEQRAMPGWDQGGDPDEPEDWFG